MYNFYPYFTNDGSVGLFSESDNDIYHSTYGALTEAYEKFILPADFKNHFKNNNKIKILDICFGIGYNSKSFINYFIENIYNDTIYTNNINTDNYNVEIYTDNNSIRNSAIEQENNKNFEIYIKAIDIDKILAFLSPFIICDKKKLPKNYKLPFKNEKISKMLNKPPKDKIKFLPEINLLLYQKIIEKDPEIFNNEDISLLLNSPKYKEFFEPSICRLFEFNKNERYSSGFLKRYYAFLHNIYYRYLSSRYKNAFKSPVLNNFIFDLKIEDARKELLHDNNKYDYIFLDAFTPAKCPALWSVDFFRLLYEHLNDNGMILTYSNSASIRNAFLHAGFFIGKTYNNSLNKFMGTVAVKNKSLIKHELSEYDLGLLKTKAGIFYRDENLTALNEAIINSHKIEVEKSNLISSSRYIKSYKTRNILQEYY